jgi:hypothetical protein
MNRTFALLVLISCTGFAQVPVASDTPLETVRRFKMVLETGDVAGMCELMADPDSARPLQRGAFEKMQSSMEGLLALWRGTVFSYGEVSMTGDEGMRRASVRVRIQAANQQVIFSLIEVDAAWYIIDIGITFY